jgi:cell division protein FtsZ
MGTSMMGMGEADGEERATSAAEAAISNPLLDVSSMKGAKGVLINITGGMDLTLFEVDEAANKIRQQVDPDANIIVGSTFDERLNGRIRVSVVATGIAMESKASTNTTRTSAAAETGKRTAAASIPAAPIAEAPRAIAQAPIAPSGLAAAPIAAIDAGHPVHAMQSDIIRSGIAHGLVTPPVDPAVCPPVQRGYAEIAPGTFDPALVASIGAVIAEQQTAEIERRATQAPVAQPAVPAETRKSSGFSVFGITIGGTSTSRKTTTAPASPARTPAASTSTRGPSQARIVSAPLRDGSITRDRQSETLAGLSDDQLDIPAFLRRQSN